MDSVWYFLAKVFQKSFHILEFFNRNMNITFIVVGFIALFIWLSWQNRLNKEAEAKGTLK